MKGDTAMLKVVDERTHKTIWTDFNDAECRNKAQDFITYKGYYVSRRERLDNDLIIWVRK